MHWNSSIIYTEKKYLQINWNSIYTYYKSSGIRIPLAIKNLVGNWFEFHYSLKK